MLYDVLYGVSLRGRRFHRHVASVGHVKPVISCCGIGVRRVLTGCNGGNLRLLDIERGSTQQVMSAHSDWVTCCA